MLHTSKLFRHLATRQLYNIHVALGHTSGIMDTAMDLLRKSSGVDFPVSASAGGPGHYDQVFFKMCRDRGVPQQDWEEAASDIVATKLLPGGSWTKSYDPTRSKPFTFFYISILNALKDWMRKDYNSRSIAKNDGDMGRAPLDYSDFGSSTVGEPGQYGHEITRDQIDRYASDDPKTDYHIDQKLILEKLKEYVERRSQAYMGSYRDIFPTIFKSILNGDKINDIIRQAAAKLGYSNVVDPTTIPKIAPQMRRYFHGYKKITDLINEFFKKNPKFAEDFKMIDFSSYTPEQGKQKQMAA